MFEAFGATFGATLAGCLTLVAVTGAAVYFFMKHRKNAVSESASVSRQKKTETERISFQQMQTILQEEIKNVRELVTVRKNFTSTVPFSDDKKIPLLNVHMPGSDRKILLTYSGSIVCGCDLNAIRFLRGDENQVKIFVPQSRILDIYADVKSFKIHHQDTGIFASNIKIEEQNELIANDLEAQRQLALNEKLPEHADENVRQMLMSIISKRGLNQSFDVEILTGVKSGNLLPKSESVQ